jgi:hypothetical protein
MSMEFVLGAALKELPPAERQAVAAELRRMADEIYKDADRVVAEDHAQHLSARADELHRAADILEWG